MFNNIEFSYFLFPAISLFFSLLRAKLNWKILNFLTLIILIGYLAFSLSGADYESYEYIYNNIKSGIPLDQIHGEIGYKKLNQLFVELGLDYKYFKIIYYSILYFLLYYSLENLSNNLPFSFFIGYTGFLLYFLTINRQFLSMVICLFGFSLYKKNKNSIAIIINFLAIFIHISSVIPLIYFLFIKNIEKIKLNNRILISIIIFAIFIRCIIGSYFNNLGFLFDFIGRGEQFRYYAKDFNKNIFTFGLVNRLFFLSIVLFFINKIKNNTFTKIIFIFYFVGSILYILIPLFIIERLTINNKFLEILIIPNLIFNQKFKFLPKKFFWNRLIIFWGIFLISLVLLFYQLRSNNGYSPYKNILIMSLQ